MLTLAPGEIHLWLARDEQIVDTALLARYLNLLDDSERAQQQRFYFARHRHQYLVTRALLRSVLSLYAAEVPATAWSFAKNDYGKPAIRQPLPVPLWFNLSHTEGLVVLAVAGDGEVGVDVECTTRRGDVLGIADHYFSPLELQQLRALPPLHQLNRFFDLWTLKEAYIKACGMGLSIPLDHFSYRFREIDRVDIAFVPERDDDPALWQFWQLEPGAPHKIALAARREPNTRAALTVRHCVPLLNFEEMALPFFHHAGPTA